MPGDEGSGHLTGFSSALAVCAHPDDESFGLGAVLAGLARGGTAVSVLCLTHGEASTLGASAGELGEIRTAELAAAADALGVRRSLLLGYADGGLDSVPLGRLAGDVRAAAQESAADLLVVFDENGVTGHDDHRRATAAALAGAAGLPVLGWSLPAEVAEVLNVELGARFAGRRDDEIDFKMPVDRRVQHGAIACHASQCTDNPVLWRRLELLGDVEALRWLRPPAP